MVEYVRPGDTICVVRLDRLGRSLRELIDTVEQFKEEGIGFCSLEEAIDTSTATGDMVFHIFSAIAQFEQRLAAERTADGIRSARARDRHPGRPHVVPKKLASSIALVGTGVSVTKAAQQLGIGRTSLFNAIE